MDKPTKPIDLMPRSFGGVKSNWSSSMQTTGYEDGIPAIYDGGNLNYQLNATGKELDYCEKICDFINEIPIGKTITVNENNKLVYEKLIQDVPIATVNNVGVVKPDGITVAIDGDGTISATPELPSQSGNSGKYLITNGTNTSWTNLKTINSNSLTGSGNISIVEGHTWGTGVLSSNHPAVVVSSYVNGESWYRVYSDNWCEQGGLVGGAGTQYNISLLKRYKDTFYNITYGLGYSQTTGALEASNIYRGAITENSFVLYLYGQEYYAYWRTSGFVE